MKNNLSSILLIAGFMTLSPCQAITWPWEPKNYEECVAEEMKDRANDQTSIISSVCRKRFPALPSFIDITHVGTMSCAIKYKAITFRVKITNNMAYVGILEFEIKDRSPERMYANQIKRPDSDTTTDEYVGLYLNFEEGIGKLTSDKLNTWFDCHELPNTQ